MKALIRVRAKGSKLNPSLRSAPRTGLAGLRNVLLAVSVLCILSCLPVRAAAMPGLVLEDDVSVAAQKGADSRAVRLSSVDGQVRVVQDGQVIADPAYANLPLFEGSQIITGNDGRAEVQLEDGSVARLSPNSTLTFSVLQLQGTSSRTEVVLNSGLAYFELQPSNAEHSLKVSYGTASFTASSFSVVRIRLDAAPGDLAVFSGNVHLERGNALQLDIHGGESLGLDADNQTRYSLNESIEPDSWDSWNSDRDQALNANAGERTAATGVYGDGQSAGMSDLDANGSWFNVPGSGYVWSPFDAQSMGAGWDPYGYGRWVFYPRYGYVWVSGYGWGYAPYQCGLWNYYDNFGWGWVPGNGCNTWWGGGGWGYNIGNYPRGYQPPKRPFRPIPGPVRPHPIGQRGLLAASVVPVDRRPSGSTNLALYARPTEQVVIAGHTVEPLRPVAPRQSYERSAAGYENRSPAGNFAGGAHPAYSGSYVRPAQPGSRPAPQSYASHTQSAPASHMSAPSGGGGGGGGGHASSGGGGGGGSHK